MLDGVARKIGLAMAAFAFLPWLIIVVGFGLLYSGTPYAPVGSVTFPYYMVSVGGMPFTGLACVHAAVSTPRYSKILRAATTVVSVVYLTSLGMIIYETGNVVVQVAQYPSAQYNPSISVMFSGSLLLILMWTGQMVMWPFYEEPSNNAPMAGVSYGQLAYS